MTVTLPDAQVRDPACGACGGELEHDGDWLVCFDCHLKFDPEDLTVSYRNPGAEVCGAPCDNFWHGDGKIRTGMRFDCHPCQLPAGHNQAVHWRGCEMRLGPGQQHRQP